MQAWSALPVAHQQAGSLSPATVAALPASGHADFTQHMQQAYIKCAAAGGQHPAYK